MPKFTRVPPTSDAKVEYFIEQQRTYRHKKTLLNLFTVGSRPCFSLPKDVYGAPLILMDCEHLYEAMPYIQAEVFHVNADYDDITALIGEGNFVILDDAKQVVGTESLNSITFSTKEYEDLKSRDSFTTTRILDKKESFYLGQFLRTPWNDVVSVTKIRKYRFLKDHPFLPFLTDEEKKRIDGYPYKVLYLEKYREGAKTAPSKNQSVYAVAMVRQPENAPIGDDRTPAQIGLVKLSDDSTIAPYRIYDTFVLQKGMITNFTETKPVVTTMGLFVLNAVILAHIFGDKIPYINSPEGTSAFEPGKIDSYVAELIRDKKAGRSEYSRYMDDGYFLGHLTQICVPGLSKKALTTDPRVKIRAQELYQQHATELHDPVVVTKIEDELIGMDKDWIRGDSAERYYAVSPKKSYREYRKKMFLTMGLAPSFVKGDTSYETIQGSLADGWKAKDLNIIANEIRRGSYDRGIGTAKGGEQTKFILRLFNATRIIEDDCGSNEGNEVMLTQDNYKDYLGRYIVLAPKKYIELTATNISQYVGKRVVMRSPQFCETTKGLCFTCCGEYFRTLDTQAIGMLAVQIGSKFTSINMDSMHFSGVTSTTITDLTPYLIF